MRVCMISPGHLSTNPRLVKEASALQRACHDIHVVHGRFKSWGTQHDSPLAAEFGHVTSIAFGPSEASRLAYLRQNLIWKGARALVRHGLELRRLVEASHGPAVNKFTAVARNAAADLYIAHYVAALPAAARAASLTGAAYAYDAEDFELGVLPESPDNALDKRIIRTIESSYLPGAAYVTAASPMIAEAYADTYGIPEPTVILNVFPKANAPLETTLHGKVKPGPSLYWFSQTIGAGRGLETAIEAIARAESRPHLYLRGTPASGYDYRLQSLAYGAGVADRLHFLPPAPPNDLERLGASYDLGYSGETGFSPNNERALGNKLFSYLLGGVPSLVSDIPAHRRMAQELGKAATLFPICDAQALAEALDRFLLDPDRLAAAREHAWNLGQSRFNWEVEQAKLIGIVSNALRCPKDICSRSSRIP